MSCRSVQILLSTYNGENYLMELLDSILQQTYKNVEILVRDDGSTDNTINLLKKYEMEYPIIKVIYGKNIGAKNSFIELIKQADKTKDYYAFADQDDIWLEEKLERAVRKLDSIDIETVILYCSPTILVDKNLNLIHKKVWKKRKTEFGNALIENIACGCTMVVSNALLQFVCKYGFPTYLFMHDWFLYMIASAFGKVIYDKEGFVLYRQHDHNAIGNATTLHKRIKRKLKNMLSQRYYISKQIEAFRLVYPLSTDKKDLAILLEKREFFNRIKVLFNKKIFRQSKVETIIFKLFWLVSP